MKSSTYTALSLKLIGDKPGGALRIFCDPAYKTSIPAKFLLHNFYTN